MLGYFDREKKDQAHPDDEQVEVLDLIGDIALGDGEPKLHPHVVVGKADGSATAVICSRPTCAHAR